ncbi:probable serine/threonine-protein kinase WNK11 [Henckelia pumila]|uniref:probable serine/threonine-protein kinase WNK11 n=1 Tax=Henckelia pumila TaxID=405737 RepID=UPI003C6DDECA
MADEETEPFVELSPTGRYGRYSELLGAGAVKKVYRAFDQEEGLEVAWNQVKLGSFSDNPVMISRLHSEVLLLGGLDNKYILSLHSVWRDDKRKNTLNFITEACTSGNLREYRFKHKHVSLNAIKKWAWQILKGLEYLHAHLPCVIHRDLNCSNVFINGNTGQLKIGDFGLAAIVERKGAVHSVLGTPEFMAPELYEENYTELVDVYSFGMCLLEMVTLEVPYKECRSIVAVYRNVVAGVRPQALDNVDDSEVRAIIDKCLAPAEARPSAIDLLGDPFFDGINDDDENDDPDM